jgi:hypothetical protein
VVFRKPVTAPWRRRRHRAPLLGGEWQDRLSLSSRLRRPRPRRLPQGFRRPRQRTLLPFPSVQRPRPRTFCQPTLVAAPEGQGGDALPSHSSDTDTFIKAFEERGSRTQLNWRLPWWTNSERANLHLFEPQHRWGHDQ